MDLEEAKKKKGTEYPCPRCGTNLNTEKAVELIPFEQVLVRRLDLTHAPKEWRENPVGEANRKLLGRHIPCPEEVRGEGFRVLNVREHEGNLEMEIVPFDIGSETWLRERDEPLYINWEGELEFWGPL